MAGGLLNHPLRDLMPVAFSVLADVAVPLAVVIVVIAGVGVAFVTKLGCLLDFGLETGCELVTSVSDGAAARVVVGSASTSSASRHHFLRRVYRPQPSLRRASFHLLS